MSTKNAQKNKDSGTQDAAEAAHARLTATGRNDVCPCGSNKKYKKCHLLADEETTAPSLAPPDPMSHVNNGWRLFEQRRPGAAEKEFRAALALDPEMPEARVGVGMAKLSAGDTAAARTELDVVVAQGEPAAEKLRKEGAKDAFTRRETQPYLRASHALGCLAYDENRFEDAAKDLERVYSLDEGAVGTEARLIAGKSLVKLGRAAEAVPVLEPATSSASAGRAQLGLVLAQLTAGNRDAATEALGKALEANPHFAKALLGRIRKRVDNMLGATPGSLEEAVVYAQTYGDVWKDDAKKFLEDATDVKDGRPSPTGAESASAAAGG